uniref:Uncharacterized protein n=1 Tax=uncultured marine microorganism HF4000_APKG7H23 TaxID=455551 RepID=B3T9T0_9ZZZZ|nr:hypothetical protein ALOHA_HF4000APKG7H23ctg3g4 [uncultured marine microorganism HF4000_APKG7H23]
MAHLSGPHQVAHGPHGLLHGNAGIGPVDLVQVNVAGLQLLEAGIRRFDHVSIVQVSGRDLGGKEEAVPLPPDRLAYHLLRLVLLGGVDEETAHLHELAHQFGVTVVLPRAQTYLRHHCVAFTQRLELHALLPPRRNPFGCKKMILPAKPAPVCLAPERCSARGFAIVRAPNCPEVS